MHDHARTRNRLQAVLEDANLKLASVVTDSYGVAARAMLAAILDGQRDVETLADLARGRLRAKRDQRKAALEGRVLAHQRFWLTEPLSTLEYLDEAIARVSGDIAQRRTAEPEAIAHKRELKRSSPMPPDVLPSRYLLLTAAVGAGSLGQPGSPRRFLLPPPPWPAAQKAAQTGPTCLEPCRRPGAVHLLPHGVQPTPAQEPTAHHRQCGRDGGVQQGPEQGRGVFVQRPRHQQGPHCRCHTGAVLTAHLIEA